MDLGTETMLFDLAPEQIGAQIEVDESEFLKASFGGDRSAAGRYAAEQRWKGHVKREDKPNEQGSLDDEVARVSGILKQVAELPARQYGSRGEDVVVTPEEYDSYRGAQFVWVRAGKGKTHLVVTKPVLEAEAEVRALGARALKQVHAELVASGRVTQEQLDDATTFMASQDDGQEKTNGVVERAMAGDTSLPQVILTQAERVKRLKEAAKTAKGALMKATRAYNEARARLPYGDPEVRRLWEERRNAKHENNYAKIDLRTAELELKQYADEFEPENTALARAKDREQQIKNAIMVQGLVGERVKELLSSRRQMADSYATKEVSVPQNLTIVTDGKQVDPDARVRDIMAETRRRIPEMLLDRLGDSMYGKVKVIFTSSGGGSYSQQGHTIRADMDDADTLTHETVHGVSYQSKETRLLEQAALQRRVFGDADKPEASFAEKLKIGLQKVIGATAAMGRKFGGDYIKDKFVSGYQGRLYDYERDRKSLGKTPDMVKFTGATEILTVSTENLFGGGQFFRNNGKVDVELMELSLGWLLTAEGGK